MLRSSQHTSCLALAHCAHLRWQSETHAVHAHAACCLPALRWQLPRQQQQLLCCCLCCAACWLSHSQRAAGRERASEQSRAERAERREEIKRAPYPLCGFFCTVLVDCLAGCAWAGGARGDLLLAIGWWRLKSSPTTTTTTTSAAQRRRAAFCVIIIVESIRFDFFAFVSNANESARQTLRVSRTVVAFR